MTDYVYKDYVFNDKTGQFEQITFDKKRKLVTQPKPVEKKADEKPKKTTGYDRAVGNVDTKNEIVNKGRNFVNSTGASVAGNTLMLWDTLEQNFKDYLATLDPGKNLNKDQYMKDYQNLYLKQNDLGSMNPINFPSMSQPKQVGSPSVEVIKDIANPGSYKMNVSDPNKDKKEAVSKAKNKLVKSEIHNPVNLEGKLSGDLKKYAAKEREKSMEGIDNEFIKVAMDLGYTMAEMAPAAALGAINPALGAVYLGANAAGNQMYDVTQRGGNASEAFASGVVTGGIELATEALPLKMFADTLKTGGKLTSNIARQALTEGAEEGLSYILGNTAEQNMLGDLANPFSNEELFQNIVMGGLSGGILGGAGTVVGNYKQNKLLKSEAKTDLQLQSQIQQAEAYEKNAFDDKEAEQLRTFKDTKQLELDESLKAKDEELSRYVASKVDMYEMLKLSEQEIQSNLKRDVNAYKRAQGNFRSQAMISSNPLVQMEAQRENAESISSSGKRYKVTEDNIKAIQDVSSKIGVSVRFEDAKKMPYGSEGYYRNGEIVISNETKNPVLQVFGHEVTHYAEDSDFYQDYVNVATHLITKQGRNFEAVKQEFVAQYAQRGVQLTEEDATHEVLAHFTQELITNEKELNDLVRTDMNVAQKILNWIKSQLSRFGKDADLVYARDVLSKAIANPNLMDKGKEQYLIDKNENNNLSKKKYNAIVNDIVVDMEKYLREFTHLSDIDDLYNDIITGFDEEMLEDFDGNTLMNDVIDKFMDNNHLYSDYSNGVSSETKILNHPPVKGIELNDAVDSVLDDLNVSYNESRTWNPSKLKSKYINFFGEELRIADHDNGQSYDYEINIDSEYPIDESGLKNQILKEMLKVLDHKGPDIVDIDELQDYLRDNDISKNYVESDNCFEFMGSLISLNSLNNQEELGDYIYDKVYEVLKDKITHDKKVERDKNAKVKSLDDIKFSLGGNLKDQSNRDTKGNYFVKDSLGKETYVYKTPASLFLDAEGNKIPVEDYRKVVRRYLLDNYKGKLINIGDLYDARFSRRSARELAYKYTGDKTFREIKHEVNTEIEPLLKNATFIENAEDYGHHPEATGGWDYFKVNFGIDNGHEIDYFTAKANIMIAEEGPLLYDINEIKRSNTNRINSNESTPALGITSNHNIEQESKNVNNNDSKYSLGLSLDKVDNSIKVNNHIERGMKEMVGDYFYNPLTKDDVREALKIGTREILDEGEILENTKTALFNRLVDSMVNKDRSSADEYKDLILDLQNTVFKIDDKTKHNISNFQDIKKTAGLRSNLIDGIEIDSKYDALNNSYPYLFPKEIINVYDQFTKIAEVKMGLSIKYTPLKKEAYFDKQFESILKKEFEDFITSYTAKVLYSNNPKKYESYMKRVKKMILGNETVENIKAYSEMLKDGEDYGIIEIDNSQFDASKIAASVSNRGSSNKPLNIVLDENSGINEEMREELADAFERPLNKAKGKMTENVKKNLSILKGLSKNFGIKVGSLESEALQRYVSKKRLTGDGIETVEYTITDLQSDLPNTWRNVVSAAKVLKPMIDEYVVRINSELEIIYPGVQEKADSKLDRLSEDISFINTKLDKTKKIDLGSLDKDAKTATVKAIEKIKINLSSKITEYNNLSKDIDSGEIYRNKRLMPKNDYFHHIRETNADDRLSEIFSRNNGVSNQLASISEFTKPNAIWSSLLQKQTGGKYKEDAMASMLDYVRKAEYKIAIDPLIAEFRGKIKNIVEASNNLEVNNNDFIQYLSNFVNDLAGKTNPIDRSLGGQSSRGRARLKVAKKINNVLKRSMVFGSFKSAISQFFNLPNSMAILSMNDPKHFVKDTIEGINKYSKYVKTGEGTIHDSIFINERYLDNEYNYFDEGIWKHPRKLGNFTMEFGDRVIAEITWFSAYEQGKSLGKENLIEYADDITKRAVGGRGIGEIPLMQKSELIKLVAPFQLEVNNQFILQNKLIKGSLSGDKEKMLGFLMMVITGTLINAVRKEIDGSTTAPDYIGAFLEGYEDSEDEDRIDDKIFKIGKRLGGEYLSNMPMGSQISQVLFPSDIERKQWFGESDPTRYGTGLIPIDYVVDPIKDFIDGKNIDPKKIISPWLPVGGKQVERTLNFLEDSDILPDINFNRKDGLVIDDKPGARNQSGEIKFNIDKDPLNIFKGFFFGTSSTKNAIEYYENDWKPLNENRTSAVDQLHYGGVDFGESYEAMRHTAGIEGIKGLTNSQGILARDYLEDINMWDQMKYDEFIADQFGVNKTVRTMPDSEFEYKLNNGFGSALDVDKSQKMDSYMKKYNLSNNDIYGAYERTSEIESIKDVNGKSINLSQDAQQRKILQDFGIWEQVGKDLEFSKLYGIETTVFNWTQEEFDKFYKSLIK